MKDEKDGKYVIEIEMVKGKRSMGERGFGKELVSRSNRTCRRAASCPCFFWRCCKHSKEKEVMSLTEKFKGNIYVSNPRLSKRSACKDSFAVPSAFQIAYFGILDVRLRDNSSWQTYWLDASVRLGVTISGSPKGGNIHNRRV